MIIDTSALIAILLSEEDQLVFKRALSHLRPTAIGAPTRFELLMVCHGKGGPGLRARAATLLSDTFIETVDWTGSMAEIAVDAFVRYGRGSGHAARLNFGDCMSYAVAKALDRPLLFKGDDFARTDIVPAI